MLTNALPPFVFVMRTPTAKTLWDRIAALAEPVFLEMDILAEVGGNLIRKRTVFLKPCRCKELIL